LKILERKRKSVNMSLYDLASRFRHALGIICTIGMEQRLWIAHSLGCAMPMSLANSNQSCRYLRFFQQSGVEVSRPVIADSVLRAQSLGCYHCKIESRLMLDIFQCQSCRQFILLILGTLYFFSTDQNKICKGPPFCKEHTSRCLALFG